MLSRIVVIGTRGVSRGLRKVWPGGRRVRKFVLIAGHGAFRGVRRTERSLRSGAQRVRQFVAAHPLLSSIVGGAAGGLAGALGYTKWRRWRSNRQP